MTDASVSMRRPVVARREEDPSYMTTKKDNPSLTFVNTDPRRVAGSRSKGTARGRSAIDDPLSHAELDFVEEVRAWRALIWMALKTSHD